MAGRRSNRRKDIREGYMIEKNGFDLHTVRKARKKERKDDGLVCQRERFLDLYSGRKSNRLWHHTN